MKYIGCKRRLIPFIEECLITSGLPYNNVNVIDLFSGTGSVSEFFMKNNCNVRSCDNMSYSVVEQYRKLFYKEVPEFEELIPIIGSKNLIDVLNYLNNLPLTMGYFYENYAPNGKYKRQYFSDNNAKKIDSIREKIEKWKTILPTEKRMFLIGILMHSADRVSNTSGTYGAFLKIWRSMALKPMTLEIPELIKDGSISIHLSNAIDFLKANSADIVYLDPPYNSRQYASNFHVLENITLYDKTLLKGVTGIRPYEEKKSNWSIKTKALKEFKDTINNIKAKYIIMSYSTEGLIKEKDILEFLNEKGSTIVYRNRYRRFKTNAWTDNETGLEELLFICKVR